MNNTDKIEKIISDFEDQLLLARATDLAKCGKLLEAEFTLCKGARYPTCPQHLDLLARIYVQKKAFEDAKKAWLLASQRTTENEKYLELVKKLEVYEKQYLKYKITVLFTLVIMISIITVIVWFKVVIPLK